jgi:hypothetical protein
MDQVLTGTVRGNTIVLDSTPAFADGEPVRVTVCPVDETQRPGDGIRRSAGALALEYTEEDDRILAEIQQARRIKTRPEIEP